MLISKRRLVRPLRQTVTSLSHQKPSHPKFQPNLRTCSSTSTEAPKSFATSVLHHPSSQFAVRVALVGSSVGLATPAFVTAGIFQLWFRYLPKSQWGSILRNMISVGIGGGVTYLVYQYVLPFLANHSELMMPFAFSNALTASFWYALGEGIFGLEAMTGIKSIMSSTQAMSSIATSPFSLEGLKRFFRSLPLGGLAVGALTSVTAPLLWPLAFDLCWDKSFRDYMFDDDPRWMERVYHTLLVPVALPVGALAGMSLQLLLSPIDFKGGVMNPSQMTSLSKIARQPLPMLLAITSAASFYFLYNRTPPSTLFWEKRLDIEKLTYYSYNPFTHEIVSSATPSDRATTYREMILGFHEVRRFFDWFHILIQNFASELNLTITYSPSSSSSTSSSTSVTVSPTLNNGVSLASSVSNILLTGGSDSISKNENTSSSSSTNQSHLPSFILDYSNRIELASPSNSSSSSNPPSPTSDLKLTAHRLHSRNLFFGLSDLLLATKNLQLKQQQISSSSPSSSPVPSPSASSSSSLSSPISTTTTATPSNSSPTPTTPPLTPLIPTTTTTPSPEQLAQWKETQSALNAYACETYGIHDLTIVLDAIELFVLEQKSIEKQILERQLEQEELLLHQQQQHQLNQLKSMNFSTPPISSSNSNSNSPSTTSLSSSPSSSSSTISSVHRQRMESLTQYLLNQIQKPISSSSFNNNDSFFFSNNNNNNNNSNQNRYSTSSSTTTTTTSKSNKTKQEQQQDEEEIIHKGKEAMKLLLSHLPTFETELKNKLNYTIKLEVKEQIEKKVKDNQKASSSFNNDSWFNFRNVLTPLGTTLAALVIYATLSK